MNKCEFCTAETMVKVMEIQATSRNTKNYNINKRTEHRNK